MKISQLLIFLLISGSLCGQNVFTSYATEHFPSAEKENIDRVITIDDKKITIKSVVKGNDVDIQTLFVIGKITNYHDDKTVVVYKCLTRNGRYPTTVMISKDKPEFITLHEPSLTDPEVFKEYKLLLD